MKRRIMVIGAAGQIGSELIPALRELYGCDNVLAVAHKTEPRENVKNNGPLEYADVTDRNSIETLIIRYKIDTIHHLASILSGRGEQSPDLAWEVNINGLKNVLDLSRDYKLAQIIVPSSIAVFGPQTPQNNTAQETVMRPNTIYGITKLAGELLCDYYHDKYGVDVRGMRFPGLISHKTLPGGGTTDYAVAIFYAALKYKHYNCFVEERTVLPMMYMPDAIRCFIDLQEADGSRLKYRNAYNVTGFSFNVSELVENIRLHIPDFQINYQPDFRQKIADSWPNSIDDSAARQDWEWKPTYTLNSMTEDMISQLRLRQEQGEL
jgi:nucleoside-diphosphate-sugar epimerase